MTPCTNCTAENAENHLQVKDPEGNIIFEGDLCDECLDVISNELDDEQRYDDRGRVRF